MILEIVCGTSWVAMGYMLYRLNVVKEEKKEAIEHLARLRKYNHYRTKYLGHL